MTNWPRTTFDTALKRFIVTTPGMEARQDRFTAFSGSIAAVERNQSFLAARNPGSSSTCFHLTRDINTTTGSSNPLNYPVGNNYEFAVLGNTCFFSADDGISGRELWKSDGTSAGTQLVKDIIPGASGSDVSGIVAFKGKIYFSARTIDYGFELWVSDGTEAGTQLLKDLVPGLESGYPSQLVVSNDWLFFTSSSLYTFNSQLWKTDGTNAGTILVMDIYSRGTGWGFFQLTSANNLVYFVSYLWNYGYQLMRSDGTDAGTQMVKQIGFSWFDQVGPMNLTSYNNLLYFSADDGTGRRLWVTDGTEQGTNNASGFNDVLIHQEFQSVYTVTPFPVMNNILFFSGYTTTEGSGLFKFDAGNQDGIVLVKDLTDDTEPNFVVPVDMRVANEMIYFKVINFDDYNYHDELWLTNGETSGTSIVKVFEPGDYIYNLHNSNGIFFFVKYDPANGNELWKSNGSVTGTILVKDIFVGSGGSYPENLTFCNGKLLFRAEDVGHGAELWSSNGSGSGTELVKDINNATTMGSDAGFIFKSLAPSSGNSVIFGAYTPESGVELYKSDGTANGTVLLNEIADGPQWSYPNSIIYKNGYNYFIGDNLVGTTIYRTDGTPGGLSKQFPDIDRGNYTVWNFAVTDNRLVFCILYNIQTGGFELWRSDGSQAGTFKLNVTPVYGSYLVTAGNTVYFSAYDAESGHELWKSNGLPDGTRMVKDINKGLNSSYPYSLFVYKNEVYFGAHDGFGLNNQTWKSDGTERGTRKLSNMTPAYYYYEYLPYNQVFCLSDNTLFFTAFDYQTYGAELWKTNGAEGGTVMVKDINPIAHSNPYNLTDVNGTLFFSADDGVHGTELWSSKGTAKTTNMVKDITPDYSSYLYNFCSVGGRLYFQGQDGALWSSDGTAANTLQVIDEGLTGITTYSRLVASGNKLFFGAWSPKYGGELFVGEACVKFPAPAKIQSDEVKSLRSIQIPQSRLFPNPATNSATLDFDGEPGSYEVAIGDISGKTVWQGNFSNANRISLPIEKLSSGIYVVTIRSGSETRTLKLVKQ